ncbi:MAG: type VI secretion system baseplate subunit TssE [bacterium]
MAFFNKFTYGSRAKEENEELLAIVENLNNILNIKKNYGSFLTDLGIRDMNEYTSRDRITKAVMEEVKQNIERFEPRVRIIGIQEEQGDNPFMMSFSIECMIRQNSKSLNMIFNSVLNNFRIANP